MQSRTVYVIILCLRWYKIIQIFLFEVLGLGWGFFPILFRSKDVMSSLRTRNNASVITPERNVSRHASHDQLACPLCKQLFLQPFKVPCNHCICEKCITKSKTKAEVTEDFYVIVCTVCSKAHSPTQIKFS